MSCLHTVLSTMIGCRNVPSNSCTNIFKGPTYLCTPLWCVLSCLISISNVFLYKKQKHYINTEKSTIQDSLAEPNRELTTTNRKLPFAVEHTSEMELRMSTGTHPLVNEHSHVFSSDSEDRFSEHICTDEHMQPKSAGDFCLGCI